MILHEKMKRKLYKISWYQKIEPIFYIITYVFYYFIACGRNIETNRKKWVWKKDWNIFSIRVDQVTIKLV